MATGLLFVFNLICGLVVSLMDSNSNAIVGIICDRFHTVDRSIDSIGYFAKCSGRTASSTMAREWWVEVVVNGPKRKALIGHPWYGLEWKRDPRLCESYFDGEVLAEHWLNQRRFQIYKSIPESRIASVERIKTEFVFECTGVWPLTTRYDGGKNASSIAHILDSSSSWNVTECTFEGQPCVSVCNDWHSLLFSKLHGFSLRRRFSKFEDNEKMSAMFCNDNLTEVVPGIWMPQNFSRTIYLGELNRFPELSVDMREESVYSSVKHEIQTFFLNQPDRLAFQPILEDGTIMQDERSGKVEILPGGLDLLSQSVSTAKKLRMYLKPNRSTLAIAPGVISVGGCLVIALFFVNWILRRRSTHHIGKHE